MASCTDAGGGGSRGSSTTGCRSAVIVAAIGCESVVALVAVTAAPTLPPGRDTSVARTMNRSGAGPVTQNG